MTVPYFDAQEMFDIYDLAYKGRGINRNRVAKFTVFKSAWQSVAATTSFRHGKVRQPAVVATCQRPCKRVCFALLL